MPSTVYTAALLPAAASVVMSDSGAKCVAYLNQYQAEGATVAQMQHYARCVEQIYPTQGVDYVQSLVVGLCCVGAVVVVTVLMGALWAIARQGMQAIRRRAWQRNDPWSPYNRRRRRS